MGNRLEGIGVAVHWIGVIVAVLTGLLILISGGLAAVWGADGIFLFSLLIALVCGILAYFPFWITSTCIRAFGELLIRTANIEQSVRFIGGRCNSYVGEYYQRLYELERLKRLYEARRITPEEYNRRVAELDSRYYKLDA